MESIISRLFLNNWQRKILALIAAIVIWLFVNHSITETKTIPNVPIRIINLPTDKTIVGLLPNGMLSKRITLSLSGTKDVIDELEPGDLEVLLDASTTEQDEWIVQISKKNLVSLNPNVDLLHHITNVQHSEFVIKLSRLITAKIPITLLPPIGDPPAGYEFLDIWPQTLQQTVSGSEEEIKTLKTRGIEFQLDLSEITKSDLDTLKSSSQSMRQDEVSFIVPNKWKHVEIPIHNYALEEINDPDAQNLRIDFLRKQFLPLERDIPVTVFYPLNSSSSINPETVSLEITNPLIKKNGITTLALPLFTNNVSQLFLEIVRDHLQIVIVAVPPGVRESLQWSIEIIDPHELENTFLAFFVANEPYVNKSGQNGLNKQREMSLRKRFQEYAQRLIFYIAKDKKFSLESKIEGGKIKVRS
jgi:hypothetical protein